MRRRDFTALLGGAAVAWPLAARAQQSGGMRRVGLLIGPSESDPINRAYAITFREVLSQQGWAEGRNLQIDLRFGEGDARRALALICNIPMRGIPLHGSRPLAGRMKILLHPHHPTIGPAAKLGGSAIAEKLSSRL